MVENSSGIYVNIVKKKTGILERRCGPNFASISVVLDGDFSKELEGLHVEKLNISWATTKNFVDCGIFVMRHMEMFNANYARSWDCGFPKDERAKKIKCDLLRKKRIQNVNIRCQHLQS
ncbi:hypothetical protein R6Q57_023637 [Mikania cordata]